MIRSPTEFAVCMGMDAFRLCICKPPRNFTADEVVRWIMTQPAALAKEIK